ncbi:MAG: extracellular solute-binding protein [Candidatus Latescibacteria bacterium]|jgi:multiple sugar transport system substrate-binding protein|nr:hypothetical protein [Chloroflexota bacterium]MDP7361596.1 extracellular solute-binding protein [Candidatus Latescibacterota bacterium]MDP7448489.1 extracellular solute-binding protein [Candidatus Latescibacterota bacterium]MDP7631518.1 extracellular solute-binding protein [Candidatus Latescibacterota bacterium]HCV23638.1 hypothetical protein [Candidatus Latescibacterota bacterium]|tara:strand:- start:315 stop:1730 length:1416 start_codon:yes stop_codon:yes gene_type:complete
MKYIFLACILLAGAMYAFAVGSLETIEDPNRTTIIWSTDRNPARLLQVDVFERMFPQLHVVVEKRDETKIIVRCATGTGPDVIDVGDVFEFSTLVEAGVLMDLTPYAERMGFAPDKTYASLEGAITYEGRQYRFPCNVHANAVIYNRHILEDHDAPMPQPGWTWDDFVASALAVRNNPSKSGQEHIPLANWLSEWVFQDLLISHGGRFFSDDGLHSALAEEPALASMRRFRDMALVDDIMPTSAEAKSLSSQGGWGSGGIAWFFNQQAAYIFIGRWGIVRIPAYLKRNPQLKERMASIVMPRAAGRPPQVGVRTRAAGINAKSERPEEAMAFLQYLASDDYSALIVKDGDSLPPSPALAGSGQDLTNDIIDREEFHQPFIDAARTGRPLDVSPFVESQIVKRWIKEAVESVENGADPDEELRRTAAEVDARIRQNLRRRPELQAKFEAVTGRPYHDDWWRPQMAATDVSAP